MSDADALLPVDVIAAAIARSRGRLVSRLLQLKWPLLLFTFPQKQIILILSGEDESTRWTQGPASEHRPRTKENRASMKKMQKKSIRLPLGNMQQMICYARCVLLRCAVLL